MRPHRLGYELIDTISVLYVYLKQIHVALFVHSVGFYDTWRHQIFVEVIGLNWIMVL